MKTWVTTEVHNHCEQKLLIQPTPESDGIEIYIQESDIDSKKTSGAFYINKEELPILVKKLQEMLNYVMEVK